MAIGEGEPSVPSIDDERELLDELAIQEWWLAKQYGGAEMRVPAVDDNRDWPGYGLDIPDESLLEFKHKEEPQEMPWHWEYVDKPKTNL